MRFINYQVNNETYVEGQEISLCCTGEGWQKSHQGDFGPVILNSTYFTGLLLKGKQEEYYVCLPPLIIIK